MARYKGWMYLSREEAQARNRKRLENNFAVAEERANRAVFEQKQSSSQPSNVEESAKNFDQKRETSLFKKLGKGALQAVEVAGKVVGAAGEYVGQPVASMALGMQNSERKWDEKNQKWYRDRPKPGPTAITSLGVTGTLDALQDAGWNPIKAYQESRKAWDETLDNPNMSGIEKAVWRAGADPLTYVPVGAVGRIGGKLGTGVAKTLLTSSKSPIGAVVEGAGKLTPALVAGSEAGRWTAEKYDIPFMNDETENIVLPLVLGGFSAGLTAKQLKARKASNVVKAIDDASKNLDAKSAKSSSNTVISFETRLGSQYEINEGGTVRTKSLHPDHDPTDVGIKPKSDKTFYVDEEGAKRIGMWGSLEAPNKQIYIEDNQIVLTSVQKPAGSAKERRGVDERIPFSSNPRLGVYPLEVWGDAKGNYGSWHIGNEIVGMKSQLSPKEAAKRYQNFASKIEETNKELEAKDASKEEVVAAARKLVDEHAQLLSIARQDPEFSPASVKPKSARTRQPKTAQEAVEDGLPIDSDEAIYAALGQPQPTFGPRTESVSRDEVADAIAGTPPPPGTRGPISNEIDREDAARLLDEQPISPQQSVNQIIANESAPTPPGQAIGGTPPTAPGKTVSGTPDPNSLTDVLNATPIKDLLDTAKQKADKSIVNRVSDEVRKIFNKVQDPAIRYVVDPIMREKNKLENDINSSVAAYLMRERNILKKSGLTIQKGNDGAFHLMADGKDVGLFEDVIEGTSAAGKAGYDRLNQMQKDALQVIEETNKAFNETMMKYGAEVRLDDEIEGIYFGRRREKPAGISPSRTVGVERIKSRTVENMEEGIKRGIDYSNPWDARAAILKGKLLDAQDKYLINNLSPLGQRAPTKKQIEAGANPMSTFGKSMVNGQPGFQGVWFSPEIAKRIQRGLDPKKQIPIMSSINKYLTPLRSSFDASAAGQQGLRMFMTDPIAGMKYWWAVTKSLKDEDAYFDVLAKFDAEIPGGITELTKRGLHFTAEDAVEEMLMPSIPGNIRGVPVDTVTKPLNTAFAKSNQHYSRLLNTYRLHFASNAYKRLTAQGLKGDDLEYALRQSMNGINRMFGWSGAKTTSVEDAVIFAPRYFRASLETMTNALTKRDIEGNMARTHLGLMLGEGAALAWFLNTIRGEEMDSNWINPTDPNFLRVKNVGGVDISLFGTYNTLFQTVAAATLGPKYEQDGPVKDRLNAIKRLAMGKFSPAAKLVWEPIIEGSTYLGAPQDPIGDPLGVLKEQAKSTLPFTVQNIIGEGPLSAAVGFTGLSNTPLTPTERRDRVRDEVADERFGTDKQGGGIVQRILTGSAGDKTKYDDLRAADKSRVNEDAEVRKYQEEADKNVLTRKDDRTANLQVTLDAAKKLDNLSRKLEEGGLSGNEWREQYQKIQAELRGARNALGNKESQDKILQGWFKLYDQAEMDDGRIDYEKLEVLQAEYEKKNPDIQDRIDNLVGTRDNETMRQYRKARELAAEYYSIPAYRGMTLEKARKASEILEASNDLVASGRADDRSEALRLLRKKYSATEISLAKRAAQRKYANPAREKWRNKKENALFFKFYSDIPGGMV